MNAGSQLRNRPISQPVSVRRPSLPRGRRPVLSNAEHLDWASQSLGAGAVLAHGFANFYAITTRPDLETVSRVNQMKGRPAAQVGSVTAPPRMIDQLWDYSRLPLGWDRRSALRVMDAFFRLGPFGFRGAAAPHVPEHLSTVVDGVRTVQLIAPGHACPSNALLERSLGVTGGGFLYITSANRSRHLIGVDDSPAHWKAAGLLAEFGQEPDFLVLEHDNEDLARQRYPHFLPMSTTILGFGAPDLRSGDRRPSLVLERQGSLPVHIVRAVLDGLGFGLTFDPTASTPLQPREYLSRLCDRLPGDA